MPLVAYLLCTIGVLLSTIGTRSQLSDLKNVTFYSGMNYTFDPTSNYVVLQRQGEYLHIENVRVFNGESEVDKSSLVYHYSSKGHVTQYCYIYDSNSGQTQCHTADNDNTPLLIVNAGQNYFDRVKVYNRQDGYQYRILDVYLQFWIQGTLEYQTNFSEVALRYTLSMFLTGCVIQAS